MPGAVSSLPIAALSPYADRWVLHVRATSKSALRPFTQGTVFNIEVVDKEASEIRCSFFNEAARAHYEELQVGMCLRMSGGRVKHAKREFRSSGHPYEITFDKADSIEIVEDDPGIVGMQLHLLRLDKVECASLPVTFDLCGIVVSSKHLQPVTSGDGPQQWKRDLVLADDSDRSIRVTLWNDDARMDEALFNGHPVVCLKRVAVSEWNGGRFGSLSGTGGVKFGSTLEEARLVADWWAGGGCYATMEASLGAEHC